MGAIPQVRASGPLWVAEIDCCGCEGLSSLVDQRCRVCVLKQLGAESAVDQVVLKRGYHRIYNSKELSKLARTFATIKLMVHDHALYAPREEGKCRGCVDRRQGKLSELWSKALANPHDPSIFEGIIEGQDGLEGECTECTRQHLHKLLSSIKAGLTSLKVLQRLTPTNYDEVFVARTKPFFVDGVWRSPKHPTRLIDSYALLEDRGQVRIYEQLDRPVPFYELDLPEFKWPAEHIELLDEAFRMEMREAPGHARFAYPTRIAGFAEDWYSTLLHMVRERLNIKISSGKLRELAKRMASWLAYRVLEPFSCDDHITDIYVPAPPELQPIYVVHDRWETCETGIYWTTSALLGIGETLASRLGTAFDEVRPQLDVEIPELGMRLFMSRHPAVWPRSISIAIRKRRRHAWTQPLFLARGTLTPLASSLVSNIIRAGASAFIIGEKGSAKTSKVETLIPEIGPHERIICYQDTEELHLEEFIAHGYKLENVRIANPDHLQRQIDAFLRGGEAFWLITEVRALEAVKATLGAAARQGSQPLVTSFHVKTKREMYDLICRIMGLHEAAYKYIDFIVSTARFSTPRGSVRRIIEIVEVLKEWEDKPEYVELFVDDRRNDQLVPKNFLKGDEHLIRQLNSHNLSNVDVIAACEQIEFLPPSEGGSHHIPMACERLAIETQDFLTGILVEAKMKSDLLNLSQRAGDTSYLELPFVSKAYDAYFALKKKYVPDYERVLEGWRAWLRSI
ncbi:MAG: ATPase, T2SS/T4P/T4SS family [Candidatus Hodarchaeaceae archaeon]|nr:ATPase, T2SS/T4P/T4SS family [Candidatus Hodarchaeaceae archaeon]